MRATALTEAGPVDSLRSEVEATPADWPTTRADPHTNWTEHRGPVNLNTDIERRVIKNGYIGDYNPNPGNISHPYVEYQLDGTYNGRAGTYQVGGYWSGHYFYITHAFFSP